MADRSRSPGYSGNADADLLSALAGGRRISGYDRGFYCAGSMGGAGGSGLCGCAASDGIHQTVNPEACEGKRL
ncbi:hypothetical protein D3C76_1460740 [compost metagenome]